MPLSLLKASPSATNLQKKVGANIHLPYLVAACFWPGRCPGSFRGPVPSGLCSQSRRRGAATLAERRWCGMPRRRVARGVF